MPITCPISFEPLSTEDFGDLDYSVMPHAFASHNELGRLADEAIYQRDFASRLSAAVFKVSRETPVTATFESFNKVYSLDLTLDDKAIYELKAVVKLTSDHVAQLLNYLHLVDARRGKLINFRTTSVESKFVNAPMSRTQRQRFMVNDDRWQGDTSFHELVVALLRDWGTGLELALYHQALVHLLGGEDRVAVMVPMHRDGLALGNQRFFLSDPRSAFRVSAFSVNAQPYESQLKRLLHHSPLTFIHWINIDLETVTFTTIKKS